MNCSWSKDDRQRKCLVRSFVAPGEEFLDRWKYLITGLVTLAAISIMTSVVVVQVKQRMTSDEPVTNGTLNVSREESRLEHVLNEIASNMNPSFDPCDDFYEYACGSFPKRYPREEDKAEVNYQTLYAEQVYKTTVEQLQGDKLLSNDTSYLFKYIKRFWDACLNDIPGESLENEKFKGYLAQLDQLDSLESVFQKVAQDGYSVFFTVKIKSECGSPTRVIIGPPEFVIGAGYTTDDCRNRMGYYYNLGMLLSLEDLTDFNKILKLDHLFMMSVARNKGIKGLNSVMSVDELSEKTKMNWNQMLSSLVKTSGPQVTQVEVEDVEYVNQFRQNLEGINLSEEMLRNYVKLIVVNQICFFLNEECRVLQFQYLKEVMGECRDVSEFVEGTCFDFLVGKFEDLIFRIYEMNDEDAVIEDGEKYYLDLIGTLASEFTRTVNELTWMDTNTKGRARLSIESLCNNIEVKDPSYVEDGWNLQTKYGNGQFFKSDDEIDLFEHFWHIIAYVKKEELKLDEFQRRPTWPISLFSAVPYVSQETKKILVPDFFLRGPFTAPDLPESIKFGSLASMLAREMTHSFDEIADFHSSARGTRFWTDATRRQFHEWTKCVVEAYNEQESKVSGEEKEIKSTKLNETFRLNENLADLIGVNVAYRAYKRINSSNLIDTDDFPDALKNLTADQLLFLSFANVHCSNQLDQVSSDVITEATNRFMVNLPLAHNMEFAHAFKCKAGSRMNPPKKCPFT